MELEKYTNKLLKENKKYKRIIDKYAMGFDEATKYIEKQNIDLQQENQQFKIQISAREEEYKKLEDNWNKLKEIIRKKQDYYRHFKDNRYRKFLSELLDKMQELEGGVSDER